MSISRISISILISKGQLSEIIKKGERRVIYKLDTIRGKSSSQALFLIIEVCFLGNCVLLDMH